MPTAARKPLGALRTVLASANRGAVGNTVFQMSGSEKRKLKIENGTSFLFPLHSQFLPCCSPREAPVMRAVPFDDELLMFLSPE
jgi:hypothetical protein